MLGGALLLIPSDTPIDNIQFSYADADQSKGTAQDYQNERRAYNRICKQKDPSTGDECQDAKNNLTRLELCQKLRSEFTNKWHHHNPENHATENANAEKAVENAKEKVRIACGEDCI